MPLELAELAAGLPFAASFAMAGGISALREGRKRAALNEAMHELRRPLQVIAFLPPHSSEQREVLESSLRLTAAAVDRLDCEINGRPAAEPIDCLAVRPLVEAAVERWRVRASLEKREVNLEWKAGDPSLRGDSSDLVFAVDNLINNGLVHGSGEVAVQASRVGSDLRLVVRNRKAAMPPESRRGVGGLGSRISGRCRHGHGLRIVRRAAARSGGSFSFRRHGDRCEATLEIPLAGGSR